MFAPFSFTSCFVGGGVFLVCRKAFCIVTPVIVDCVAPGVFNWKLYLLFIRPDVAIFRGDIVYSNTTQVYWREQLDNSLMYKP